MTKSNSEKDANLTFYIFEGVLVSIAGAKSFHLFAYSGGGSGSTKNKTDFGGAFYPYTAGVKTKGEGSDHIHGGVIPPGKYKLHKPANHRKLGLSVFLEPANLKQMLNRDGFYIHKPGPHGSDGCLVIKKEDFDRLIAALRECETGTLFVEETMGQSMFA